MKNEEKLISVIIPVYNAEETIERCVESVINQTYRNIQIVLINDGSKDNSFIICTKLQEKYSCIILINQENKGVGFTRNRGIVEADGEYICFIDADDYVDKNFIELLVNNLQENNSDLSICGYREIKEGQIIGNTSGIKQILQKEDALELLLKEDSFKGFVWNKLFKKEIITKNGLKFDESLVIWEDVLFSFEYLLQVDNVVYDPKPIYNYIYVQTSASHSDNHVLGVKKSYDAILAKQKMINLLPFDNGKVSDQINIRLVKSSLATIRNIAFSNEIDNENYYLKCANLIKDYGKSYSTFLTRKERVLVSLINVSPTLFIKVYSWCQQRRR